MRTRIALSWTLLIVCSIATTSAAQQPKSTLERIKKEGVLKWGADASGGEPFVYTDPKNPDQVTGFEVEIVEKIAQHLGVKAQMEQLDWATLIPSLETKRIDLAFNGMELKPLSAPVCYTVPYFQYFQQLTVRAGDKDRYRTLDDLKGKRIAVLNGSASIQVLQNAGWTNKLIDEFDDSLKPYAVLRDNRVDAALAESIIAKAYAGNDAALFNQPTLFSPGLYVGVVREEDGDLLHEVNSCLERMKHNGELAEIYRRYGIYNLRQRQIGILRNNAGPDDETGTGQVNEADWGRIAIALLQGAGFTLLLTAISMPLALAFGLVLALMVRSGKVLLAWPAQVYIQVIRGTPLLVQIYVIFFTLPQLGRLLETNLLTWPALLVGVLCLAANYAAYEAEIHRAGLDAVPRGQREAALSLGMSERQAFFVVVLPQSFRIILPPVLNDLISMLKDSCMVSVVGVGELLFVASSNGKATGRYGQLLMVAGLIYLVLSLAADFLGKRLERYLRQRGTPPVAANPAHH